jgi:tetratricopeptide (TPR) repeat protein
LERFKGQCEFCKRIVELQNYETTLCACVIFIPVIPLGRKQILNYCPNCRRHRVASMAKWREVKNSTIDSGLAKLAESPDDPTAVCRLLGTYMGFRQFTEMTDLAGAAQRQFFDNPAVQVQTAVCFEQVERKKEAEAGWRRALELEPQNLVARRGLIRRQFDNGALAESLRLLKSPPAIVPSAEPGLYMALAQALQAQGSHREALDLLQEVLVAVPRFGKDRAFRSWVKTSERALNAESSLLPSIPVWRRRGVRWATFVAVLLAVPLCVSWYLSEHRTLHVVNGFDVPITYHVDGEPEATLLPRDRKTFTLAEGAHHATYKIGNLPPQEVDFKISDGFFARFGNSHIPVLDPGGGAALVWEQAQYSERGDTGPLPFTIILGQDFASVAPADYVFEPFPQTVQIDAGKTVTKAALHRLELSPAKMLGAFDAVPVEDKLRFAEAHLSASPDDGDLVFAYINFAVAKQQAVRCRNFLAAGLDVRPVHIDWHRGYQTLQTSEADGERLRDQYAAMLAKEPKNSALLYLRGRLETAPGRALDYYEQSIAADPANPYPRYAKSYQLLRSGNFAEAQAPAAEAFRLAPNNSGIREQWRLVRLATGDYQRLGEELRQAKLAEPLSLDLHVQLLHVLAAEGLFHQSEQAQRDYETRLRALRSNQQAVDAIQVSSVTLLYEQQKFSEMLARANSTGANAITAQARFCANLELGRLEDAAASVTTEDPESFGERALCLSIAWRARKDDKQAAQWQAKARKALDEGANDDRAMAGFLDALPKVDMAAAQSLQIEPGPKSVLLLALAQQCPEHRAELLSLATKLNFVRDVPYFFLQRTIKATDSK